MRVARLNLVFLAPVPGSPTHDQPMFTVFREPMRLPLSDLKPVGRLAAMAHDARVAVLRRDALFGYRGKLSLDQVFALERTRAPPEA